MKMALSFIEDPVELGAWIVRGVLPVDYKQCQSHFIVPFLYQYDPTTETDSSTKVSYLFYLKGMKVSPRIVISYFILFIFFFCQVRLTQRGLHLKG